MMDQGLPSRRCGVSMWRTQERHCSLPSMWTAWRRRATHLHHRLGGRGERFTGVLPAAAGCVQGRSSRRVREGAWWGVHAECVSSGDAYAHAIGPLFVSPNSSDRGVGKTLMKSLVEHAHKLNAPSIRLTTGLHNRSVSGRAYNDNKRGCLGGSREQSHQREGWRRIRDINTRCSLSSPYQMGADLEARACKA